MFSRFLLPCVAVILFLIEPIFTLFSRVEMFDRTLILVPHILFMFLLFLSVYFDRKTGLKYAIIFGLLYDIVYVDILGLYTVLFPVFCFLIHWIVRFIQQSLFVITVLTIFFVAVLEFVAYEFFLLVDLTSMAMPTFLLSRLLPTILANFVILIIIGWLFKYLIKNRKLQSV